MPATTTAYTGNWAYWQALGINANKNALYCGYIVNIGVIGAHRLAGTIGSNLLGAVAQTTPWWYAVAICDNDGNVDHQRHVCDCVQHHGGVGAERTQVMNHFEEDPC